MGAWRGSVSAAGAFLFTLSFGIGCAAPGSPYRRADPYNLEHQFVIEGGGEQIEHGRPNWLLDGVNHYLFSLPTKLLLWNYAVLDHRLPESSRALLDSYIRLNDLRSVKIRHNEYAPIAELRRLRQNRNIGAGFRYSFGLVSWLFYTLLPDRLFAGLPLIGGGDHFNPYTNTVHVYSSSPSVLLHEAGHAKDYIDTGARGMGFVFARLIPGVNLIQEGFATTDAIRFLGCIGNTDAELDAYRTLYPAYSTYVASYVPGGPLVTVPAVLLGHAAGWIQSFRREREQREETYLRDVAESPLRQPYGLSPCVRRGVELD